MYVWSEETSPAKSLMKISLSHLPFGPEPFLKPDTVPPFANRKSPRAEIIASTAVMLPGCAG